jgi:aerobic-type carbon monoxide dehydrogenase small subunit (CoxS/CutS family)
MTGKRFIELDVNGETREVAILPSDTLLETLRDGLTLTGAKRGCNQGVCGACTVMVDGLAARACLLLSITCTGRRILTVEGLMRDGELDPVQQAFVDAGAVQCGFCMPGMVMAAKALLESNPRPGVDEIREAIAENICRCSGYLKIVEAIQLAGQS